MQKPHEESIYFSALSGAIYVDKGILPIVRWLDMLGIKTVFSCEGDRNNKPSVMFEDPGDALLYFLWRKVFACGVATVHIHFKNGFPEVVQYVLSFKSKWALKYFIKKL